MMTQSATTGRTITGVDCHAHIMQKDAPLVAGRHSEPKYDVTAEDFIAMLDAHGVSHGVLTQPSFYGTDNSLLLSALARYPDRLRGTAIVSTEATEAQLAALRDGGIRGIRLNWFHRANLPDVRSAAYGALFARVRDAGLHVELYLEGAKIADVLPEIRRSGAPVMVDHFGSPEPQTGAGGAGFREVLKGLAAGDTWVKLSAPYRLGGAPAAPYVDAMIAAGGLHRLVWGSDWPWVSFEDGRSYEGCLNDLRRWIPDAAQRDAVFRSTAAEVFGF